MMVDREVKRSILPGCKPDNIDAGVIIIISYQVLDSWWLIGEVDRV
jgi:hypothetical protein